MVQGGRFQLFNDDPRRPHTMNLTYNFTVSCPNGERLHFNGYKVVDASVVLNPLSLWRATTTLYCTVSRLDEATGEPMAGDGVRGKGVIHIRPSAFLQECTTMQATGATLYAQLTSTANFLGYFTRKAAGAFLTPFVPMQWPSLPFRNYTNPTPWTKEMTVEAQDGVRTKLYMWSPQASAGGRSPLPSDDASAPIVLFIPGAATDHQIFALPTIETNAVDYFRAKGCRVYCHVPRVGKTVVAQQGGTTFDARRDIRAALEVIRRQHGLEKAGSSNSTTSSLQDPPPSPSSRSSSSTSSPLLYVVAHGAGSLALASGLLDGTVPRAWLGGVCASQVFMNPILSGANHVKARLPLPPLRRAYGLLQGGSWYDCASTPDDSYVQQAINQATRFYPVGRRDEICSSVVCHRSSLAFGR